ncbi:MAG TPA: sugar nucleotide-binding protein [Candidatus Cybelea sp.]|nr:sugar nucleotide-binding protein [Candidatus Cybelea sp.]
MPAKAPVLVVGGDGLIGRALVRDLRARGHEVIATSRRPGSGALVLDLAEPASWPVLPAVSAAVIVSAVARLNDCERDPQAAHRVNAAAPALLAERFAARGVQSLLLSTDKVFDGTRAMRGRDDAHCPLTEYGRQKAWAERAVLRAGGGVLRLSKVLSPELDLLRVWRVQLLAGQPIAPFHDMWLAPVTVEMVCGLAARLIARGARGIYHCTGAEDLSYVELARALARAIGADEALMQPKSAAGVIPPAMRVRHSTLEMRGEAEGLPNPEFETVVGAIVARLAKAA